LFVHVFQTLKFIGDMKRRQDSDLQ
jgi:hypothetical protein